MARPGKWDYWLTDEGLTLVTGWAMDGLTDIQIAKQMGIADSTFREWKKRFPTFSAALKKAKAVVDRKVEQSLYDRCHVQYLPYQKAVKMKKAVYDDEGKFRGMEDVIEYIDDLMVVQPDTTAIIFWLKNRKPAEWRDKPAEPVDDTETGIIVMPPVGDVNE